MQKLIKSLKTFDENLIRILIGFFIFLIPLYPKFPFRPIPYTYISIRLEDFYVVLLAIVFVIQLLRKKIQLNKTFLKYFIGFWAIVFTSYILNAYVFKVMEFPHLGFLHSVRRVQYMIIFFIAASTITSYTDFKKLFKSLIYSLILVLIYGLGQRFFEWPAVSTMNPEFARGHLLILTPEARLSSTFAGHYDLAAYLIFLLPIVWGAYYTYNKRWMMAVISFVSIAILFFTSSRVSFGAFVVSVPFLLLFFKKYRMFFAVVIFSGFMMYFSKDMTNRFLKTFQIKQILVNEKTGQVFVPQKMTSKELPAGSAYVQIGTEKAVISTNSSNYKQEMIDKALYEANVAKGMQGLSASETASITKSVNDLTAVNTVVTDISSATRFQVEWPRAINALLKNPLLGSGPSSITESTDNDYLRWLGEYGLLGFGAFLLILYKVARMIFDFIKTLENKMASRIKPLMWGYLFGLFALLVNATYIDVFEASKVAYVFWYTTGIFIGLITVPNILKELSKEK